MESFSVCRPVAAETLLENPCTAGLEAVEDDEFGFAGSFSSMVLVLLSREAMILPALAFSFPLEFDPMQVTYCAARSGQP